VTDLSCNEFVELVTEYLDGTLDDDTLARFVDHISVCDGCEQYLDQVRRTVTTLADLPADERLPAEARERLLDAFRNRPR
jgi:anti-sigma factor RsiW